MSQQSADSELADDISPLDYARQNGISRNYLNDTVRSHANLCCIIQQGVQDPWNCDENLSLFDFGSEYRLEECPTVSKDAAILLSSVFRPEAQDPGQLVTSMFDARQRKRLKILPPLLWTDHEFDCKEFRRRDNFEIQFQNIKLPLELVDEEKGEGLSWPTAYREIGPAFIQTIRNEKPVVTRETLSYIQNTTNWSLSSDEVSRIWRAAQTYKKKNLAEPTTPPLMPVDKPTYYEPDPDSETFMVPILSDPPDLTQIELAELEGKIFLQDAPTPIRNLPHEEDHSSDMSHGYGTVKMKDVYSPLASIDHSSPPVAEPRRFKFVDLKVETLLTPTKPVQSPIKLMSLLVAPQPFSYDPGSPPRLEETENRFFKEAFGPSHERITRKLEQEQLIPADALSRVEVPKMDFTLPISPWQTVADARGKASLNEARLQLILEIIGNKKPKKWGKSGKREKEMNRQLFDAKIAQNALIDRFFSDDSTWKGLTMDDGKIIDSSSITWKRPGLMICVDTDDEDELEAGEYIRDRPGDMNTLIRKRKLIIAKDDARNRPATKQMKDITDLAKGTLLGGPFSAQNSVDNFMEIRGTKPPKLAASHFFPSSAAKQPINQSPLIPSNPQRLNRPVIIAPPKAVPVPTCTIPAQTFNIILSTEMYKQKDLVKMIERTIPTLKIIERDFSTHNTVSWLPNSVARSPMTPPLAAEADLVVSPFMGIIITTLQKISQKPSPGDKKKPEIRERIEKVSQRYETLLILVSEDNKLETANDLDSHGSQALVDFMGFTAGLECDIAVNFVAGGDDALAQWLMYAIIQHRADEELISDETSWELFLRRAGMNSYASQCILNGMRAPEGVNVFSPSKAGHFGLAGFVEMDRQSRIDRFGGICGRRSLERVSGVIDAEFSR